MNKVTRKSDKKQESFHTSMFVRWSHRLKCEESVLFDYGLFIASIILMKRTLILRNVQLLSYTIALRFFCQFLPGSGGQR